MFTLGVTGQDRVRVKVVSTYNLACLDTNTLLLLALNKQLVS